MIGNWRFEFQDVLLDAEGASGKMKKKKGKKKKRKELVS